MAAKQKWIRGEVETARRLLENGFQSVVNKESIYLAAVKLERESGENERARKLLAAARIGCRNSEKVGRKKMGKKGKKKRKKEKRKKEGIFSLFWKIGVRTNWKLLTTFLFSGLDALCSIGKNGG